MMGMLSVVIFVCVHYSQEPNCLYGMSCTTPRKHSKKEVRFMLMYEDGEMVLPEGVDITALGRNGHAAACTNEGEDKGEEEEEEEDSEDDDEFENPAELYGSDLESEGALLKTTELEGAVRN